MECEQSSSAAQAKMAATKRRDTLSDLPTAAAEASELQAGKPSRSGIDLNLAEGVENKGRRSRPPSGGPHQPGELSTLQSE